MKRFETRRGDKKNLTGLHQFEKVEWSSHPEKICLYHSLYSESSFHKTVSARFTGSCRHAVASVMGI